MVTLTQRIIYQLLYIQKVLNNYSYTNIINKNRIVGWWLVIPSQFSITRISHKSNSSETMLFSR